MKRTISTSPKQGRSKQSWSSSTKRREEKQPGTFPALPLGDYINIFHSIPVPVVLSVIADGRILEVSDAWSRDIGYSREETIGRTTVELGVYSIAGQRERILEILSGEGGIYSREFEFRLKSGQVRPYLSTLIPLELAGQPCILAILQDNTKQVDLTKILEESTTKFQAVFENSRDAIGVSKKGNHEYVNPAYLRLFGYSSFDELLGQPIFDLIAPGSRAQVQEIARSRSEGIETPGLYETIGMRKDGSEFEMEIQISTYQLDGEVLTLGLMRDITERKQAEAALRRLNRELQAISLCNKVLVRAEDEQALVQEICRIVCDEADYRMAWVGFAEQDEAKTVRPVAWAGTEDGYLASAHITWSDSERGQGPTGTTIRIGQTTYIQDFEADPRVRPWLEGARQRGYRSSIALPLKEENDKTFGALTIYSMEPNAFTSDELRLLDELAGDLAFGISTLRTRAKRLQAEEDLKASETQLKDAQRITHIGSSYWDARMDKTTWSDELYQIVGWDPALPGPKQAERAKLYTPDSFVLLNNAVQRALDTGEPYDLDLEIIRPDGVHRQVQARGAAVRDDQGIVMALQGTLQDITERKQAEHDLRESEEKYRLIFETAREGVLAFDASWRVTLVNELGAEIFGYDRDEMLGISIDDLILEADQAAHRERQAVREQGMAGVREGIYRRKDGSAIWLQVSATPLMQAGRFLGSFIMVTDISVRKQAELDRAHQAEELARLYRASGSLMTNSSLDLHALARSILKIVANEFGQSNCSIFLVDEDSNNLIGISNEGSRTKQVDGPALTIEGPGLVPLTIRNGQGLNIGDVQTNPVYVPDWDMARSELTIPLKIGNRVVGCIDIQSAQLNAFSAEDERLMSIFSERAALALEHARIYSEMEHRLEYLTALRMVDTAITGSFDLNLILGVLLDHTKSQLNADYADVVIYEPITQTLELAATQES